MLSVFHILVLATAAAQLIVPGPPGPFPVANAVLPLTDFSRRDPYNKTEFRRILTSFYLPIPKAPKPCKLQTLPYMTPAVRAWYNQYVASMGLVGNLFDAFEMQFCQLPTRPCHSKDKFPVAIYSPGLGNSRLIYSARARSLASYGYVVVTIDHPYDAAVVEFPDGSVMSGAPIDGDNETQISRAADIRGADISFLLSQLENTTVTDSLLKFWPARLDFSRLFAFGHSLGGAASFVAARNDSRILGAADFDGRFMEPIQSQGLDKPAMLVGRPGHEVIDDTWDIMWPNLRNKKVELYVNNTQHGTYEDFPTLLALLDLPDAVKQALVPLLGTISWNDMDRSVNGALSAFADLLFRGKTEPLKHIGHHYPNIAIVRSSLSE